MPRTQIAIVDDHQIVREGIKNLIEDEPGLHIAFEASSGNEAVRLVAEHQPDLVIMDITMPEGDGIEATRSIKESHPDTKILALTMLSEDEYIRKMIKAGASGYILKNSGKEELLEAINTLLKGQHYFSDGATQAILQQLVSPNVGKAGSGSSEAVNITEREMEVLKLIVDEYTNQEIADQLFISIRTVDAHRRNLLQKTGAKNTAGLVKYAIQNHLFESNS